MILLRATDFCEYSAIKLITKLSKLFTESISGVNRR
jgi:hypothetical protein